METFLSDTPPLTVTVPIPNYIPLQRGIHATSVMEAQVKIRMSRDERRLVEKMARYCGVTMASFIRWSAVHVAKELEKHGS